MLPAVKSHNLYLSQTWGAQARSRHGLDSESRDSEDDPMVDGSGPVRNDPLRAQLSALCFTPSGTLLNGAAGNMKGIFHLCSGALGVSEVSIIIAAALCIAEQGVPHCA